MRDLPDASGLLAIALKTFEKEILPVVGAEKRYQALMIANALSIAGRELTDPESRAQIILKSLQKLLGEKEQPDIEGIKLYTRIDTLERQLCEGIGRGAYDDDPGDLMACLKAIVGARLAISNPKCLAAKS